MPNSLDSNSLYLMHLLSCALRGTTPAAKPQDVAWDAVFQLAERNSITATCAFAVALAPNASATERARWQEKVDANLMRHAIFDMEREAIFAAMDAARLAYVPLKGILISRTYPRPEMRWMCDNDFLFGRLQPNGTVTAATDDDARKLRSIMKDLGYKTVSFGGGNHDSYQKPPFLNFEPHRLLANPEVAWWKYYADPWARAHHAPGNASCSYEFPREDSYVFHIAHMFKHFSTSGHGIRGIADEWVLENVWGSTMDRAYLNAQLNALGMRDFETQLSRVATFIIGDDACGQMLAGNVGALDTTIKQMIAYMLGSGTYGTIGNNVRNKLAKEANEHGQKGSRARYLLHRAFPPLESLKRGYPVLKRAPYLLPCVYAYRFAVKPFTSTAKLRTELSIVAKENKE